ncbi:hypothetical protein ODI_R2823 [Orrella dioscoreae]|uniref:Uncharacterized protein n=2 Tax=Orrella dioscoreae TaxID=1851544 RepID=A0A1C3JZZ9_9BURK|nr:hypothetical protein ODI_02897 [Orrella dioscoreae]SOE50591.1 hypothetical protein ODI_R2823 [Orrella dioscoreae]
MRLARLLAMYALPLGIFVFMIPQALGAAWLFGDWLAMELLLLAVLAIVSYFVALKISLRIGGRRELALNGFRGGLFNFCWMVYFGSYLGLCAHLGYVPLLEFMLHGGDASAMRADFYKVTEMPWIFFAYVQSIFNKGFVPFAIVAVFLIKSRFQAFVRLAIISFLLVSAFEKALITWAYIPLFIYFLSAKRFRDFWYAVMMFVGAFVFVSLVSLKSDLTLSDASNTAMPATAQRSEHSATRMLDTVRRELVGVPPVQVASLADQHSYQFMFYDLDRPDGVAYMVNRLVWIPFVTAYDTLLYWQLSSSGSMLHFSTNRHLSRIFGLDFANLEKQVFMFQFKSGEETTGNSNAFYVAEAYVAFGLVGVVLFSILIGLMFGQIIRGGVAPFVCAIPIVALGLISVSLISTLFSGGLFLLVMLAFMLTRPLGRARARVPALADWRLQAEGRPGLPRAAPSSGRC